MELRGVWDWLHERISWGLTAQLVKNSPAMQETPVRFLGWEDPLEEGMATHSRILGEFLENSNDRGAWQGMVRRVSKSWT